VSVSDEDDEDDKELVQQEQPTTAVKDAMDEQPGHSSSKRMKI